MIFVWDDWNREHVTKHRLTRPIAEHVVRRASRWQELADDKFMVIGRAPGGGWVRVVFSLRDPDEVDASLLTVEDLVAWEDGDDTFVYVIHAMPVAPPKQKRQRPGR